MLTTGVHRTSLNGAVETGRLANINSTGKRVAGSPFGHIRRFLIDTRREGKNYARCTASTMSD
ncbi:MAG: hypothetical protein IJ702_02280 [Fretibacterium sp.]|nr:hypothetical protein [Fretibacterium sp.]